MQQIVKVLKQFYTPSKLNGWTIGELVTKQASEGSFGVRYYVSLYRGEEVKLVHLGYDLGKGAHAYSGGELRRRMDIAIGTHPIYDLSDMD